MKYIVIAYITDMPAKKQMQFNRMFKGFKKFDKRIGAGGKEYVYKGILDGKDVQWIGAGVFIIDVDFEFMKSLAKEIIKMEIIFNVYEVKDVSVDFMWKEDG